MYSVLALPFLIAWANSAQLLQLPTVNQALLEPGGEEKYFVGTVGKPWMSGTFGCVRTEGMQMHEGLDVRCLQRDQKGEPVDAVLATAEGTVVYINARARLSNYGKYIILRHQIDGLEIYSLYAHLREIRPELKLGQTVRASEPIAIMGRTTNTQQPISKDRAHLHFELNLLVNDRFPEYYRKYHAGERNDHGEWNGQNLIGIDPRAVLQGQAEQKENFSLLKYLQEQPELCRVFVRSTSFSWLRRYAPLLRPNPRAEKEGIVGYEMKLNFNGLPFELIPRAASEHKGTHKFELISVNAAEQQRYPCRHLVSKQSGRWELTKKGHTLLEVLVF